MPEAWHPAPYDTLTPAELAPYRTPDWVTRAAVAVAAEVARQRRVGRWREDEAKALANRSDCNG